MDADAVVDAHFPVQVLLALPASSFFLFYVRFSDFHVLELKKVISQSLRAVRKTMIV